MSAEPRRRDRGAAWRSNRPLATVPQTTSPSGAAGLVFGSVSRESARAPLCPALSLHPRPSSFSTAAAEPGGPVTTVGIRCPPQQSRSRTSPRCAVRPRAVRPARSCGPRGFNLSEVERWIFGAAAAHELCQQLAERGVRAQARVVGADVPLPTLFRLYCKRPQAAD